MKTRIVTLFLLLAALFGVSIQTASAAQKTTYSGRAYVLDINVLGIIDQTLVDTGPLPADGGMLEASVLEIPLLPTLSAGIAQASTVGQAKYTKSDAGVADVLLDVGGIQIGAELLMAHAEAICSSAKKATLKGSSDVVNLTLGGQPINVTGKPNQKVDLPLGLGYIMINEQITSKSGNTATITVNALRVVVLEGLLGTTVADVTIGHAEAGVVCAKKAQCPTKNSANGMGQITLPNGKATFSFSGGIKNGELFGKLNYNDKGAGMKVVGTGVTDFVQTGAKSRRIEGTAKVNGSTNVTYTLDIVDNGAAKKDTFRLRLSNGYDTGVQKLTGNNKMVCGNIRVHKPCK